MSVTLPSILRTRLVGDAVGITSVCTAHPLVIEAALRHGLSRPGRVLIEATCNQVNQDGGYTGMTPGDFRLFVERIAEKVGFDPARVVFGGDHLGPNPWKHLPAEEAMAKAKVMIAAYAKAGFSKLHLDCSMGCAGEPIALPDEIVAERAADLAGAAEAHASGQQAPVYVIGTEVPVPGGALEEEGELAVTSPDAARETVAVHQRAFAARGLDEAFSRAIAAVVQPGVEFGNTSVIRYEPAKARDLSSALAEIPQFVFEAHSTDYQSREALRSLVEDGFAILKVGPELTFALREAYYGLDAIAAVLAPDGSEGLHAAMERIMLADPGNWSKYYHGDASELRVQRHYSYSDRIRYYWPKREAEVAVEALFTRLGDREIPLPLIGQFLGKLEPLVADGRVRPNARDLVLASVTLVLERYSSACGGGEA
ncbi:D-tagatose-bisphosphate aldolase, class II, non-catalytic subunit [Aureimonas psammosilenae]|uniref:D-tagatose-bisphosphate aldolase, class II, non-catalytic subunit n=1 Tax=Aureimonas psammosilenae TaxID=2495496 RepID=UPI001260EFF8|nr:D-tagatose-bisphosphate aldolase, class II, non-catalytic subunit [Aureimonas psammosilenae]